MNRGSLSPENAFMLPTAPQLIKCLVQARHYASET